MKTLNQIEIGKKGIVKHINAEQKLKRRLMDMGFTKGTSFFVKKVAPLGDPIQITIRGYEISVRKADAFFIEVE